MAQFSIRQTTVKEELHAPLSLHQLHQQIREELEMAFPESYWVVAEVAQVSPDRRKGHCYLTLVDKGDDARQMPGTGFLAPPLAVVLSFPQSSGPASGTGSSRW